jgi:hypothetical protein
MNRQGEYPDPLKQIGVGEGKITLGEGKIDNIVYFYVQNNPFGFRLP